MTGHLKTIDLHELRSLQMKMVDYVDSLCKEKNLRYSLCGGTMLGAARHKGYIPWDDDIDIFLPRPDYEKLIQIVLVDGDTPYKMLSCCTDKRYFYSFAKLYDSRTLLYEHYDRILKGIGVFIDIFPIDGLPESEKERTSYWNKTRILKRLNTMIYDKWDRKENLPKHIFRFTMYCLFKLLPPGMIARKLNRMAQKYPVDESSIVATSVFGYGRREEMPHSIIESFCDVPFEDRTYRALADWHTYLTNIYGDYMKLPPKEQQVLKHDAEAFWKENV